MSWGRQAFKVGAILLALTIGGAYVFDQTGSEQPRKWITALFVSSPQPTEPAASDSTKDFWKMAENEDFLGFRVGSSKGFVTIKPRPKSAPEASAKPASEPPTGNGEAADFSDDRTFMMGTKAAKVQLFNGEAAEISPRFVPFPGTPSDDDDSDDRDKRTNRPSEEPSTKPAPHGNKGNKNEPAIEDREFFGGSKSFMILPDEGELERFLSEATPTEEQAKTENEQETDDDGIADEGAATQPIAEPSAKPKPPRTIKMGSAKNDRAFFGGSKSFPPGMSMADLERFLNVEPEFGGPPTLPLRGHPPTRSAIEAAANFYGDNPLAYDDEEPEDNPVFFGGSKSSFANLAQLYEESSPVAHQAPTPTSLIAAAKALQASPGSSSPFTFQNLLYLMIGAGLSFLLLCVIFRPLEMTAPARRQRFLRPAFWTDLCFFLGQQLLWVGAVFFMLTLFANWLDSVIPGNFRTAVANQPWWLQAIEVIVLSDLLIYWGHRLQHRVGFLWRFHSIHHSAKHLDFLAAFREHPIDSIYTIGLINLPMIALGFDVRTLAGLVAFRGLWAIYIHSNVRMPIGPLRVLIGAPELHHWHHDLDRDAGNYANLSPLMDVIFGTYRCPDHEPAAFGIREPISSNYVGQLLHPFVPAADGPRGNDLDKNQPQ